MIGDLGVNLTDGASKLGLGALDGGRRNFEVTMSEGRNRQIRRTFGALGYEVKALHRLQFGKYTLGELKSGEWVEIKPV